MLLVPGIPSETEHYLDSWEKKECVSYYVEQRLRVCNFRQRLDVHFPAPFCCDCAQSGSWYSPWLPDISSSQWEEDLAWEAGLETLKTVRRERRKDPDFALTCKRCSTPLRPWESDDLYVVCRELPELYSAPLCPDGKVNASKWVRRTIINIYGRKCFNCRSAGIALHVDHIFPRSKGGTAVFSNLQPLCEQCGQLKGDTEPEDITLVDDMYFRRYPSDSYEGLFW